MNTITRLTILISILTLAGCAPRIAPLSPLMGKSPRPILVPESGKSLVLIHRPRPGQGYKLYTGVWDSTNFLADLGNGHSVAYSCEPGLHYFINRSVERVGVVEAQLLPDKIYDLRLATCGAFIASFQIEPVKRGDRERQKLNEWTEKNIWVQRRETALAHEKDRTSEINLILKDFTSKEKSDRLRHLAADDCRTPVEIPALSGLAAGTTFSSSNSEVAAYRADLKSTDIDVVVHALKVLRGMNAPEAVPDILPLLQHAKRGVIRDSCRTLAVIANKDVITSIEPLLNHSDSKVRKDAEDAIAILKGK